MKKKLFIVICIVLLILLIIFVKKIINYYPKSDFVLDGEGKYIITTYTKYATMRNDGGSHTSIYYQIDFNKKTVIKCEDEYVGFKGYKYKGKIVNSKQLSQEEIEEMQLILHTVIIGGKGTINEKNINPREPNFTPYYTIALFNHEDIKIYNEDIIKNINKILDL